MLGNYTVCSPKVETTYPCGGGGDEENNFLSSPSKMLQHKTFHSCFVSERYKV